MELSQSGTPDATMDTGAAAAASAAPVSDVVSDLNDTVDAVEASFSPSFPPPDDALHDMIKGLVGAFPTKKFQNFTAQDWIEYVFMSDFSQWMLDTKPALDASSLTFDQKCLAISTALFSVTSTVLLAQILILKNELKDVIPPPAPSSTPLSGGQSASSMAPNSLAV
jgi:hypothetical protein